MNPMSVITFTFNLLSTLEFYMFTCEKSKRS